MPNSPSQKLSEFQKSKLFNPPIPFIDLKAQQDVIRPRLDAAIKRVLDHGNYIMGPEVFELEEKLSQFCGAKHVLSCSNGTDALALGLMAKNVGRGDAIFLPSFTYAATAEVVKWMDATPVFIDIFPETFNIDSESLKRGILLAKEKGLSPRGIIPVDLFGQPCDFDAISAIAQEEGLWVMVDAAQSFGGTYKGRGVGSIGDIATTSFFPAKPLGCYGDGGAVFTNDDELASIMKSLRVHGQGVDKYHNVRVGMNGRLDTLQAAILIEKLAIFPQEIEARNHVADIYSQGLASYAKVPVVLEGCTSVWAQYTIRLPHGGKHRTEIMSQLQALGIPSVIYYIKPLHQQPAYCDGLVEGGSLPVSESISHEVLSFPMSGYISEENAHRVVEGVQSVLNRF